MKTVQAITALSSIIAFGWLAAPSLAESEAQLQASSSAITTSGNEQARESSTMSTTQNGAEAARQNNSGSSFEAQGPASTSFDNLRNPGNITPPKANLWGTNPSAWGTNTGVTPAPAKAKEKSGISITQTPRARVYANGYRVRRITPAHQVLVQTRGKTVTRQFAYKKTTKVQ